MKHEVKKIMDLEFNPLIALSVIELDKDLFTIFKEDCNLSFNLIRTLLNSQELSEDIYDLIKEYFDKIILTKKEYTNSYIKLSPISESKIEKLIELKDKIKKEREIPRRYGLQKILKDVEKQNGVKTPAQRASIASNELRNIYTNLNNRLIKKMLTDNDVISDYDCRVIVSSIETLKNKLNNILKKK